MTFITVFLYIFMPIFGFYQGWKDEKGESGVPLLIRFFSGVVGAVVLTAMAIFFDWLRNLIGMDDPM